MGYIEPMTEVFSRFRDQDRLGPIQMLNPIRLRKQALLPAGTSFGEAPK